MVHVADPHTEPDPHHVAHEDMRGDAAAHGHAAGHGHDDPNAAPMHHDIAEFSNTHAVIAWILCLAATAAGIVAGLIFVND